MSLAIYILYHFIDSPDRYNKVASFELSHIPAVDCMDALEYIFRNTQHTMSNWVERGCEGLIWTGPGRARSTSVGDIIKMPNDRWFICDRVGWKEIYWSDDQWSIPVWSIPASSFVGAPKSDEHGRMIWKNET